MDIKLGKATFKTRKPSDLDAALIETTGCDASEIAAHLAGWPSAGRIATALRPFLPDEAPTVPELAQTIAEADDGPELLVAVKGLYAKVEPAAVATETPAGTAGY